MMADQELIQGTLTVTAKKQLRLKYTSKKGKPVEVAAPVDQLSAELAEIARQKIQDLAEKNVEFELAGPNQAVKIREAGQAWNPPRRSQPQSERRDDRRGKGPHDRRGDGGRQDRGQQQPARREREQARTTDLGLSFHHAYNFVPAPPRAGDQIQPPLRDDQPAGHHRYDRDRFSGWIDVQMKTITPLLIPDAMEATEVEDAAPDHKSFPLRVGPDGKPYIPPTSLKGMLRAAYEAVTNSRMAVFAGHEDRLAFRMPARDGLKLVPAVIENGQIKLLYGVGHPNAQGRQPLPAAWLFQYAKHKPKWNNLDRHGKRVWAYLTLWKHRNFQFWNVAELAPDGDHAPAHTPADNRRPWRNASQVQPAESQWVRGYVCITGNNIDRKHDERVFFTTDANPPSVPVEDEHRRQWKNLIANYQEIHADEIRKGQKGPPALKFAKWSRQVTGKKSERELSDGTLCYADVSFQQGKPSVDHLYPVNISRKLFDLSPSRLLDKSLHPASDRASLSPADRVFGWVKQSGTGAYRGNLRVGTILCRSDDAIENFGVPGVPLSILGAAKPQQARFYVAQNQGGEAQADGLHPTVSGYVRDNHDKQPDGLETTKGLRGRKVFPHHHGPPDQDGSGYWDNPTNDRTQENQDGWHQEYRRPAPAPGSGNNERDDQNRSIQAWVKPDVTFSFRIHVSNLSRLELGALLWLLSLNGGRDKASTLRRHHRLGGGKPLGFGSVELSIAAVDLRNGEAWKSYYSTLDDHPEAGGERVLLEGAHGDHETEAGSLIAADYQEVIRQSYGGATFEDVSFIAAFLRACEGFADLRPVHYPRLLDERGGTAPRPEGENFKWFGENERGRQVALPDLAEDTGLPYYAPHSRR